MGCTIHNLDGSFWDFSLKRGLWKFFGNFLFYWRSCPFFFRKVFKFGLLNWTHFFLRNLRFNIDKWIFVEWRIRILHIWRVWYVGIYFYAPWNTFKDWGGANVYLTRDKDSTSSLSCIKIFDFGSVGTALNRIFSSWYLLSLFQLDHSISCKSIFLH